MKVNFVKFEVYIPEQNIKMMREKLNDSGILKYGNYDNVISYTYTNGFWRPLDGSRPVNGEMNEVNHGSECKIEFRCPCIKKEQVKK